MTVVGCCCSTVKMISNVKNHHQTIIQRTSMQKAIWQRRFVVLLDAARRGQRARGRHETLSQRPAAQQQARKSICHIGGEGGCSSASSTKTMESCSAPLLFFPSAPSFFLSFLCSSAAFSPFFFWMLLG